MLTFHAVCAADTILVPGDYPSIQQAIDAANNGDTILVDPGTYVENIDFKGKGIVVKSSSGPESTVIDGNQKGSVVSFQHEEGSDSVIEGFTITNGSGSELIPYFEYGGGILCYSIFGICSPRIANNIITGNTANISGGIYCGYSSPVIIGNKISKNSAESAGGGIGCVAFSSAKILNNVITDNNCYWGGGGIYCDQSSPKILENTISNNTAWQVGGGISCEASSSPIIKDNDLALNLSKSLGGGIHCSGDSNSQITNNLIVDNTAENHGGGIYCYYSIPIISKNTISNNTVSDYMGGGIQCNNSPAIINNNLVYNNEAVGGGGIGCYKCSSMAIINNIIFNNYSHDVGGGIYCSDGTSLAVINNTIYGNYAYSGGGICGFDGVSIRIVNSILCGNKADYKGSEIGIFGLTNYSSIIALHTNLMGGKRSVYLEPGNIFKLGLGMIDEDPQFVDPGNKDFHLCYNSPCRDAGNNMSVDFVEDFEGDHRKAYGIVDMGADEFSKHLYYTGDVYPGGNIELKITDTPAQRPVVLWAGSDVLNPPLPTKYGDWHLQSPLLFGQLMGSVPSPEGVLKITYRLRPDLPASLEVPIQALVGRELTNLSIIKLD